MKVGGANHWRESGGVVFFINSARLQLIWQIHGTDERREGPGATQGLFVVHTKYLEWGASRRGAQRVNLSPCSAFAI